MRQIRSFMFTLAAMTTMAIGAPAFAGNIDMTFEGLTDNVLVNTHYTGDRGSSFNQAAFVGRFEWTVTSSDIAGFEAGDTIYTFCTELTEYAASGTFAETPITDLPTSPGGDLSPMSDFRAGLLSELYANRFNEAVGLHGHAYDKDKAAAFQIAAWEIVYQDGGVAESSLNSLGDITLDVNGDDGAGFRVTNIAADIRSLANTWLDELVGGTTVSSNLIGFGADGLQDQITMVPLPAAVWFAAFGLAGVAVGRRRLAKRLASSS